jgi:hypothetical protein
MQDHPIEELPSRSPIDPHVTKPRAGSTHSFEQQSGPSRIGHAGRRHHESHQQPHRVIQDVSRATSHVLASVRATDARMGCGFDTLAVQGACRGMRVSSCSSADRCSQTIRKPLPGPISAKAPKGRRHTLPGRILCGQHPPVTSRHRQGQDRVEHGSPPPCSWPSSWLDRRDHVFDTIPVSIRQIRWRDVGAFHRHSLSPLTACLLPSETGSERPFALLAVPG